MVAGGDGGEDAAEEGADGGEHQLVGGEHPVPAHHAQAGHLPRLLVQHRQLHFLTLQSVALDLHVKVSEEYGEFHFPAVVLNDSCSAIGTKRIKRIACSITRSVFEVPK